MTNEVHADGPRPKTRRCARCEWRSTDLPIDITEACEIEDCKELHFQVLSADAQRALHALESGHPLCIVCYRSLTDAERQTCERCITSAQSTLSGVRTLYEWLPSLLRDITSGVHNGGNRAEDGRPLPGGDALALLGPGSQGFDEDGETTKDGDPVSIAFELHWWERDWRETRNEPYDDLAPRSAARVARDAAGYLEVRTRWAATSHPAFDDYVRDIRALHDRMLMATGQVRLPTKLNVDCFDCGGQLVKKIGRDGLEAQSISCLKCGMVLNPQEFAMARAWAWLCANTWTDQDGEEWATLSALSSRLGRSEATIAKTWRRMVRSTTLEGVRFFHVGDVERLHATRPKRSRAS